MKRLSIGIMSQEKIRERMLLIAGGKLKPKPGDPKIWFTSMKSLAEVLSEENRALLREIANPNPRPGEISGTRYISDNDHRQAVGFMFE